MPCAAGAPGASVEAVTGRDVVAHRPIRQQLTASAPLRSAALCALLRLPALPAS